MHIIAAFLALVIIALFFMFRPPVLMVSDPYLTLLYGETRAWIKQIEISMILFRPFIPVVLSGNAPSEIVVEAIKAAHRAPKAVLFPYHYADAARRLRDELPEIPVLILGGRHEKDPEDDFIIVTTDIEADYYRAGVYAAFLVQEESGIVVFHDTNFIDSHQAAFENGLEKGGFLELEEVVYVGSQFDYPSWRGISCVVAGGPAARFFERGMDIPVILFSWVDPRITPGNIKVLLDDSPWAMAVHSLRMLEQGGGTLPSRLIIPSGRSIEGESAIMRLIK